MLHLSNRFDERMSFERCFSIVLANILYTVNRPTSGAREQRVSESRSCDVLVLFEIYFTGGFVSAIFARKEFGECYAGSLWLLCGWTRFFVDLLAALSRTP